MKRKEHDLTETSHDNLNSHDKRPKYDTNPIVLNEDEHQSSTFRLNAIKDLPSNNNGTITIDELVGDPHLRIMWQFNFSIDIDFVMSKVHKRARDHLQSTFIHGYTFSRDPSRERLKQQAQQYKNVNVDGVYLQNRYGTHHSKIMVLFYEDQTCQVVIHTGNLIQFDWENTSQGVWTSGRLPELKGEDNSEFKRDFFKYIDTYQSHGARTIKYLIEQMKNYDFSSIKAILVASVPGNYQPDDPDYKKWGVLRLQSMLENENDVIKQDKDDQLIIQCSSVGSLGSEDSYLTRVIKNAMLGKPIYSDDAARQGHLRLIFPTVDEVRTSLNGYSAGGSIFFKRQTAKDKQQLEYLRPILYKWISDRQSAAPHIKTYARVSKDSVHTRWVLLTSANLSKQAWGTVNMKKSNHWIQSWECGVLLICAQESDPQPPLPYSKPLTSYSQQDEPWSPWQEYNKPDIFGLKWPQ